uniref:ATP synthase subunit a n=3 Tax=Nemoura TaxID=62803 RepID=A0A3S6I3Q8_9NEOP|nr:ATP synthase F0 subunit 6 [Nemoura nankinensis]YP_010165775.1 ATP synthase F0 subunit 6 [Nemoura meniscata]ARQ82450.1 ATP synthase F0 subunit 6 [Nemoura nankinensis]QNE85979.1 ATP synthase F0 subunit 6 [Nemoura cinerea]QRR29788.1 ATP synthase F0 subunit 6 [Nemoura meniscata]
MMTNLFSVFDPSTSVMNLSLNWISTILGLTLIPTAFWFMPSRYSLIWNKILLTLHNEFKTLLGPSGHAGSSFMFISLFSLILFNNFLGLFPYVFTSSSHLTLTLALALPLWLSFMVYGWINHTQHMFAHLVPQGTPAVLMPFMVCIETISNVIRPGTLAVRLAANMIAGHLLLTLLGNTGPSLSYSILSLLIIAQIALLVLESAVAIIQSYVFAVLSTLYSSEVN